MPTRSRRKSNARNTVSRMDAISLLKKDHQEIRKLLKRLETTIEKNGSRQEDLLGRIENEIKAHTTIETEIFYPAFKAAMRSRSDQELYYDALEEHHVVDLVMPEVKRAPVATEKFAAKAKVLKDLIEHHAGEEETEMFPKARKAMDTAELKQLGQRMRDRKRQLTTRGTLFRVA